MKLWDISPPVDAHSPVFPGDTPYQQHWVATLDAACPVNVSAITLSPHVGAHADAPLHYDPAGAAVGELALEPYLGPCRVIHVIGVAPLVCVSHIEHALSARGAALPPRILLRTCRRQPRHHFDDRLTALDPALVEALADLGVLLIGIDSASVDPAASKELPSHQVLRRRGLRVLENLCLDDVAEGDYELIALPLRWTRADASPVRAVLREWTQSPPVSTLP
jgi:arylformamidase